MTTLSTSAPIAHALTTTPDPEWNRRAADYLRAAALARASEEYGESARLHEKCERQDMELEARFGPGFRTNPEARAIMNTRSAEVRASEESTTAQFYRPLWAAQRALALTPAPNLTAALFKAEMIEREEVWNDGQMPRNCMEIVAEDMARLAGPTPAQDAWSRLLAEYRAVEATPAEQTTDHTLNAAGELFEQLMATPAPDGAALAWKLDQLLDAGEGSSTGSYAAEYVAQTIADYRRFLGGEAMAHRFNPTQWLDAFTRIGGGYALASDRKLCLLTGNCDGEQLESVMAEIVGNPERQEQVKRAIEQRQCAEAV